MTCACQFQTFFSYGGLLVFLIALVCVMVVFSCPTYPTMCPFGFYVLILLAIFSVFQSCTMMGISHGLAKVEKLSLDELAPETMKSGVKRWGWVAKNCPSCSRCNHILLGLITLAGMGIGAGVCAKVSEDDVCQPPLGTPSVVRDFGILFSLWVLVALFGCRSSKKNTSLPHIYEPTPADGGKAAGSAFSIGKLCHP